MTLTPEIVEKWRTVTTTLQKHQGTEGLTLTRLQAELTHTELNDLTQPTLNALLHWIRKEIGVVYIQTVEPNRWKATKPLPT